MSDSTLKRLIMSVTVSVRKSDRPAGCAPLPRGRTSCAARRCLGGDGDDSPPHAIETQKEDRVLDSLWRAAKVKEKTRKTGRIARGLTPEGRRKRTRIAGVASVEG